MAAPRDAEEARKHTAGHWRPTGTTDSNSSHLEFERNCPRVSPSSSASWQTGGVNSSLRASCFVVCGTTA